MKLYFTRREVARIVGVSPETLKTWERYLPLKLRTRGGRKVYTRRDLDLVLRARRLMTEQGVPLKDLAAHLQEEERTDRKAPPEVAFREEIQEGLMDLLHQVRRLQERIRRVLGETSPGKGDPES